MSSTSRVDATPDFLRTAMEYRDRLKSELAKVDDFLSQASRQPGRRPDPRKTEYPEFLLTGNDEILEALRPLGAGSGVIH